MNKTFKYQYNYLQQSCVEKIIDIMSKKKLKEFNVSSSNSGRVGKIKLTKDFDDYGYPIDNIWFYSKKKDTLLYNVKLEELCCITDYLIERTNLA